jgi:hypothetical protein
VNSVLISVKLRFVGDAGSQVDYHTLHERANGSNSDEHGLHLLTILYCLPFFSDKPNTK